MRNKGISTLHLEELGDDSVGIDIVPLEEGVSLNSFNEWCGDTVHGFGAEVSVKLTDEQIKELHDYLTKYLQEVNK